MSKSSKQNRQKQEHNGSVVGEEGPKSPDADTPLCTISRQSEKIEKELDARYVSKTSLVCKTPSCSRTSPLVNRDDSLK